MPQIIAHVATYLKTSIASSAKLSESDKLPVPIGRAFMAESAEMLPDGHAKVKMTLAGRNEWYAYVPHWDGLPMPESDRPPAGTIAPENFKLNAIAKRLIRHFEGMELKAYTDPVGVVTIGIGTTVGWDGKFIKMGTTITEEEAWKFFDRDIARFLEALRQLIDVQLTEMQIAALTSFVYNVGINAFAKSTLRRCINERASLKEIQFQFSRWNANNLEGLRLRRSAESKLWAGEDFKP